MENDLLPCPFCGGDAKLVIEQGYDACDRKDDTDNEYYVQCTACNFARMPSYGTIAYYTKTEAIKAWNTRHTPAPSSENLNEPNDINRSTPQGDAETIEAFERIVKASSPCDPQDGEYYEGQAGDVLQVRTALQQQTVLTSSDVGAVNGTFPVDVEDLLATIRQALHGACVYNGWQDDDGIAPCLTDILTPDGETIDKGYAAINGLVDDIAALIKQHNVLRTPLEKVDVEEYLRRNLNVCKSVGIKAAAKTALDRLSNMKRPPKWIIKQFEAIHERAIGLPKELADYRGSPPNYIITKRGDDA